MEANPVMNGLGGLVTPTQVSPEGGSFPDVDRMYLPNDRHADSNADQSSRHTSLNPNIRNGSVCGRSNQHPSSYVRPGSKA